MNPLMIFAITIVAIVALGSYVHGRLGEKGAEISTYPDKKVPRARKKSLKRSH